MAYKLLGADSDSFVVAHPNGKRFTIAKKSLSKDTLKDIEQHFAKGGAVEDDYVTIDHGNGKKFRVHKSFIPKKMSTGGDTSDGGTPDAGVVVPSQPTPDPSDAGTTRSLESTSTPVKPAYSAGFEDEIADAAKTNGVSPDHLRALMLTESGGDPNALGAKDSKTGHQAAGLMQFMPDTAKRFGVTDPMDPKQALNGAAKYLKFLTDRYGGDTKKAFTAYNAGEGNVDKYGTDIPDSIPHDPDYLSKVMRNLPAGSDVSTPSNYGGFSSMSDDAAQQSSSDPQAPAARRDVFAAPTAQLPGNAVPKARSAYEIANGLPAGGAELPGLTNMIPQGVKDWWNSGKVQGEEPEGNESVDPGSVTPQGPQSVNPPNSNIVTSPISGNPIDLSPRQPGQPGPGYGGPLQAPGSANATASATASGAPGVDANGNYVPPSTSGLDDAQKQVESAINAQAAVAKTISDHLATKQGEINNAKQAALDQFTPKLKENQELGDQLFNSIKNGGNVDPERYWMSKEQGGMGHSRLLAGIGAALGGFGQGLVGGDNPALSYINQAINRDVDAQKANIDRKNTLYSMFLSKTRNDQQAYDFTKAAQADIAAGQLAQIAAQNGNPIAAANAQKAIADLRATAAQNRYQAQLQAPEIQMRLLQLRAAQGQQEALNSLMTSRQNGQFTQTLDPRLPPATRELMVNAISPSGQRIGWAPAPSKEVAEKYRTEVEPVQTFRNNLRRLRDLIQENPRGGQPTSDQATEIQSLRNALTVMVPGAIEGVNRLTEQEYKNAEKLFDNVGNWSNFVSGQGMSQINAIDSMLGRNIAAKNRTYLGITNGG